MACFQNVARHLDAGGHFVIENTVPELQRLPVGQNINVIGVDARRMSFDVYDVVTQRLTSQHFVIDGDRIELVPRRGAVRVAVGARPDGAARGDEPARALGRLAAGAVHEHELLARLDLRERVSVRQMLDETRRRRSAAACPHRSIASAAAPIPPSQRKKPIPRT